MFKLTRKKIVIIGGSSGIGLGIAKACVAANGEVIIASRNPHKLKEAQKSIGKELLSYALDISNPEQLARFFKKIGRFDHLLTPAAAVSWGPFSQMSAADEQASFNSKFWGQYYSAKLGFSEINPGGSIVFFAGCWSQRPILGAAIPASINAAIEGLGRALALELSPLRVNVISPGIIDTPVFSTMSAAERKKFFEQKAKSLPVKKIGKPEDVAMTAIYLMTNPYMTGSTIYVDGGETLR